MKNKVTIIIPVYNTQPYLRRCLDSVIKQSYNNLEIILIDDGSTDNSYNILLEYKAIDNRIIIEKQTNKGAGMARNRGISLATGEYISFIDSDDYVELSYIENLINGIKENDSFSFCSYYKNGENINPTNLEVSLLVYPSVWAKLYNSKVIKNIEFPKYHIGEDVVFNYKVLLKNSSISKVNKSLYHYEIVPTSITNSYSKYGREVFERMDELFKISIKNNITLEKKEKLEFAFIRYIIFGNFKRNKLSLVNYDYILETLEFIEKRFPKWYLNRYIKDHIWDKKMIDHLKKRDIEGTYKHIMNTY